MGEKPVFKVGDRVRFKEPEIADWFEISQPEATKQLHSLYDKIGVVVQGPYDDNTDNDALAVVFEGIKPLAALLLTNQVGQEAFRVFPEELELETSEVIE